MGSIVDIVYNSNNYSFDFSTYIVTVEMDKLLVPDLYRAIRLVEYTDVGIAHPTIAKGEGLAILDSDGSDTIQTALTVSLFGGWLVMSAKTSGTFAIKNGNLVADPVGDVFAENPLVTYIGFFSESGTIAKVAVGSALSQEEHDHLIALDTESVDIAKVNGIKIKGTGSDIDPWNPV